MRQGLLELLALVVLASVSGAGEIAARAATGRASTAANLRGRSIGWLVASCLSGGHKHPRGPPLWVRLRHLDGEGWTSAVSC